MPIETADDRAVFTSPNDFGDVGVYASTGGVKDVAGIFDDPSTSTSFNEAVTVDSRPTFFCAESDLPDDADAAGEDQIDITGRGSFAVTSIEPDGQGMVVLRLGVVA